MASVSASPIVPSKAEMLLRSFVCGQRGSNLRRELVERHPKRSSEEVEDAIQTACERFVESASEVTEPGEVYTWLRTTAHRLLNRVDDHRLREVPTDPLEGVLDKTPSSDPGPADQVLAHEDDDEMASLVREVVESLGARRRAVLALYIAGHKRPEIAERLGLSDRVVKRDLLAIMDEARIVLARRAGGGCERGEPLVLRFAYGLATSAEVAQAKLHLGRCHRCESFFDQLVAWREKAASILPAAPAIEAASPGAFERFGQKVATVVSSAKQQIVGGGVQAKQQVASAYSRVADPTPLAGIRPGTVAAVVASCITIGGGAAAYCAQQGVNPLGAAAGLIGGEEEEQHSEPPPPTVEAQPPPPHESAPAYEPEPSPTPTEEAPQVTESSSPAEESHPAEEENQTPTTTSEEPPPPPPPEQTFEPASPEYTATETETAAPAAEEAPSTEVQHSEAPEPAPVPAHSSPEFGGP